MKLSINKENLLNKSIENKTINLIEDGEFFYTLKENDADTNPILVHNELMNRIAEDGTEEWDVVLEWDGGINRIPLSEWIQLY